MKVGELFAAFGIEVEQKSVQVVNQTFNKVKSSFTKILGALGIGLSLKNMNQIIEEFGQLKKSISSAIDGTEDLDTTMKSILDSANSARVSYTLMGKAVGDLMKASNGLFSADEAAKYEENVIKLLKGSGKADSEIQSIVGNLNTSFAQGKVEASTITNIIKASPQAAELLARKVGVAKDKLVEMAKNGKISLQHLKDAFIDSSEEINGFFNKSGMTISEALTVVKNKWSSWLAEADEQLGVTKTLSKMLLSFFEKVLGFLTKVKDAIVYLSGKLGGFENLLKLILITAGALFLVFNFTKIIGFVKTLLGLFNLGNLKLLAIAAVIVLLVLAIEDFITWINGGESVFGHLFGDWEPIGEGIKAFFSDVWDWCCKVFDKFAKGDWVGAMSDIGEAICTGWTNIFESIDALFGTHIADWMKQVQSACRQWGADIYAAFHQDELKEIEESGKYGSLDSEVLMQANAYMRAGMGSEEAFEKAKEEIVTSTEALAYWNAHFQDDAMKIQAESNKTEMMENGTLTINYYTNEELINMGMEEFIKDKVPSKAGMPSNVPQHAGGTNYTEDAFIAGEQGPELIVGAAGRKVFDAIQTGEVFRNLNSLASAQYASKPTTQMVTSNNTETTNITQNIEMNNTFNGDAAIQKEASSAMKRSADDITDTLARGLAYSR